MLKWKTVEPLASIKLHSMLHLKGPGARAKVPWVLVLSMSESMSLCGYMFLWV